MAELLIGCGARRVKDVRIGNNAEWSELVTLDINPEHKPDVIHDLQDIPLPFPTSASTRSTPMKCSNMSAGRETTGSSSPSSPTSGASSGRMGFCAARRRP
jgi:hypothetical protein